MTERDTLLSPELSLLAFQRRVLALAEDPETPLRERLRFLGIVSSNIDEFYMVRMPGLRAAARAGRRSIVADDGFSAAERHREVQCEIAALLAAQSLCASECLAAASAAGVRILEWSDLTGAEREVLADRCRDDIYPALTPLAMTLSPGHPLPHLPHHALSLAVVFRREPGGTPHLAELELPNDVPRLIRIPGRQHEVITLEELIRANVDMLHPHVHVEGAHLFRVTRCGDLSLDEQGATNLLEAVATATERRPFNPAVRVELERSMPEFVREMVLESLRHDASTVPGADDPEVQAIDGLIDLRCLAELPFPSTPELEYPVLDARKPVPADVSMFVAIRAGDLLVHHPFETFDDTVVRFVREAADDPLVAAIKITLYRVGSTSPIVQALLDAANNGKRVAAFVELKARFDEEHNVGWARALERAGGSVVYGLVGLKTHAKLALVVRREGERLRRYVHVGTGNYNTRSGRQYTDLSLFSAREDLGADVADLFNELTGSSRAPQGLSRGALVAPHQLLPAIIALIERETANARAGLPAAITIKVNALSDREVVQALYAAAAAGVDVDLIVRGICTLRPGAHGSGDRIRVTSIVGRFLEHSRIYRFANGGDPTYLIGSADLRPRNLRRRVELLVPIAGNAACSRLDRILNCYLDDATAWELQADGTYIQRRGNAPGAQQGLAESTDPDTMASLRA
ncbi:polyphosphate kinase 1 [soil metagenome]